MKSKTSKHERKANSLFPATKDGMSQWLASRQANTPIFKRSRTSEIRQESSKVKNENLEEITPLLINYNQHVDDAFKVNYYRETVNRLCRLCLEKERPGESFERVFGRCEIAVQIFALTGVQVRVVMKFNEI
jgi:hypothetical protein